MKAANCCSWDNWARQTDAEKDTVLWFSCGAVGRPQRDSMKCSIVIPFAKAAAFNLSFRVVEIRSLGFSGVLRFGSCSCSSSPVGSVSSTSISSAGLSTRKRNICLFCGDPIFCFLARRDGPCGEGMGWGGKGWKGI